MKSDCRNYFMFGLRQIFAAVLMTVCVSVVAFSQSILTDDAHTSNAPKDSDSNFGTNPNLFVSSTQTIYLKFKLTPALPTGTVGSDVSKATLKVYVGNVPGPGTIDVVQVADNWSEKTITARTAPALADLIASGVSIDTSRKGQYLLIDVTNAVKDWLDTSNNYGLALVGHDATSVMFDSKENPQTSHEPELIVALNSRAGSQGPQGPEGPQGTSGAQGPQGERGEKGESGAKGETGPQGSEGSQGPQGAQGPAGPQGEKGDTGSKGDPGPVGPAGSSGNEFDPTLVGLIRWDLLRPAPTDFLLTPGGSSAGAAFDGANIWVANNARDTVTKLRASDGQVLGTFAVGSAPAGIAFDGTNILVANFNSDNVTKLRASDGAVLGTFPVGDGPWAIAFDGTNLWVTNNFGDSLMKLRADGTVLGTYPANGPVGIAFDGTHIWYANASAGTVSKRLASDGTLVGTYSVGALPKDLAFDGVNIWVTNANSGTVTKLRASDGFVRGTLFVPGRPQGVAFDGENIWVANTGGRSVSKLRASDGATLDPISFASFPLECVFDGRYIWVTTSAGTISRLSIH